MVTREMKKSRFMWHIILEVNLRALVESNVICERKREIKDDSCFNSVKHLDEWYSNTKEDLKNTM